MSLPEHCAVGGTSLFEMEHGIEGIGRCRGLPIGLATRPTSLQGNNDAENAVGLPLSGQELARSPNTTTISYRCRLGVYLGWLCRGLSKHAAARLQSRLFPREGLPCCMIKTDDHGHLLLAKDSLGR